MRPDRHGTARERCQQHKEGRGAHSGTSIGFAAALAGVNRARIPRRSENERFRVLVENLLHGFCHCRMCFDEGGRPVDFEYLEVNAAFTRLTGLAGVAGSKASELAPGIRQSNPELFEIVARVSSGGEPEKFESYLEPLERWLSGSVCSPRKGEFIAVFDDVSERKRAAKELERSRHRMTQLAEASLRIMRETDVDAMLRTISQTALDLTGARISVCGHGYIGGQFVVGSAARAAGTPDCPPSAQFVIARGGVYMELVEAEADSLRLTDEQLRAHPRWWGLPEGHVPMRGLLGVRLTDRERRTSGMILVTGKEEGEFTAEDESVLLQLGAIASLASQHVDARVALEQADRSKNRFLAMLSHELRNPLAPIKNSLYILDRVEPGSEQASQVKNIIDRQVAQLSRLVDDLLDVTRISNGKIELQREPLDFGEVVRTAVDDHRSLLAGRGLQLEISIPAAPIRIHGDRMRVAQVIGNLLANAAKFTPPAGKVSVSVASDGAPGEAVVRVRDTGPGIAADLLTRIFEPFIQAEATVQRSRGGLGLGLALVKTIAEMHGGSASAQSEGPGKGAEFAVRFPLQATEREAAQAVSG